MLKKVCFYIAIVLIISSSAMATDVGTSVLGGSVSQVQTFNIGDSYNNGMASVVALTHGDTGGSVIQSLNVDNIQSSPCNATPCFDFCFIGNACDVEALQTQCADLDQNASANGECGIINVNSYLDAGGSQSQFIGFSTSTKQQAQTIGVAAQQVVTRADGAGGGGATNDAYLSQTQGGSNAGGSVFESSIIDACQSTGTGGAANSTTALASTLLATTSQSQQVF